MSRPVTTARAWQLFAAWVAGDTEAARACLQGGLALDPTAFREMLLMLHLFAGVPRTLEACALVEAEIPDLLPPPADEVRREGDALERGMQGFETVYAHKSKAVLARLEAFHGDIAHWVIGHAYGRVLGRPGLSFLDRELLAIAALVVLGTWPQLESHVRGAVRCGASEASVVAVVESLAGRVPEERLESARARIRALTAVLPSEAEGSPRNDEPDQ